MRLAQPGVRYPKLYQEFKDTKEIADTINRSRRYVKKALRDGFTEREKAMLIKAKERKDLFEEAPRYDRDFRIRKGNIEDE